MKIYIDLKGIGKVIMGHDVYSLNGSRRGHLIYCHEGILLAPWAHYLTSSVATIPQFLLTPRLEEGY